MEAASSSVDASQVKNGPMGQFDKPVGYTPDNCDSQWKVDAPKCENDCAADCASDDEYEASCSSEPSAAEPAAPFMFGGKPAAPFMFGGKPAAVPVPEQQQPSGNMFGAAQPGRSHSHCLLSMTPQ